METRVSSRATRRLEPIEPALEATRPSRVVKRSVSLDADVDEELTARVGAGGKSRFLNQAARDALARLAISELLKRYDDEDGEVPEAVRETVSRLPRPT
jgi:hypothetical protein